MDWLLDKYGESHQNATNKMIHWICVPAIVFSLFGMIYCIPFFTEKTLFMNWAAVLYLGALLYYLSLSRAMFFGFIVVGGLILWGNHTLALLVGSTQSMVIASIAIFVVAWIGQFIGHKIEGKKPSFLEDLQFLMIGPAWLLHFIYKKLGINY